MLTKMPKIVLKVASVVVGEDDERLPRETCLASSVVMKSEKKEFSP